MGYAPLLNCRTYTGSSHSRFSLLYCNGVSSSSTTPLPKLRLNSKAHRSSLIFKGRQRGSEAVFQFPTTSVVDTVHQDLGENGRFTRNTPCKADERRRTP